MTNFSDAKTLVMSDIEGSWAKVESFFLGMKELQKIAPESGISHFNLDSPQLPKGTKFVFLGDSIDKGPDNIKVLKFLVQLKKKYPSQVVLIIGNRDVNKLRFNWELSPESLVMVENESTLGSAIRFRLGEWADFFKTFMDDKVEKPVCKVNGVVSKYTHGENASNDSVLKLKFLLDKTLGSPTAFEDLKGEIQRQLGRSTTSDLEVYNQYRQLVSPSGLLTEYLRMGELIHFDRETQTLFVHGGISNDSFGFVPETQKNKGDLQRFETLEQWIPALNTWAHDCIEAGIQGDFAHALPLIEYQEPMIVKLDNGKTSWKGGIANTVSVIHGRPWSETFNLAPLDADSRTKLMLEGIQKLVFGHSPVGQVPVLLKSEDGFITVAADTSVTSPGRIGYIEVTSEKVITSALYIDTKASIQTWMISDSSQKEIGQGTRTENDILWTVGVSKDGQKTLKSKWTKGPGLFGIPQYQITERTTQAL